ncbi:MAG: electron transfer flavoprotein subunit alpha/FixB family protein [Bryobacteraceae bacterium]
MSVLVIYEKGRANSAETIVAAQQLGMPVSAASVGDAPELASMKLDKVYRVEHPLLDAYTADGYTAALAQLIARVKPEIVLLPHTYQVRDFAPRLATRLGRLLVSDVVAIRDEGAGRVFVRQLFQGKLNADYAVQGPAPHFASIQAGAWRADQLEPGSAPVETFTPDLDTEQIRATAEEPFRESQRAVDLTAANLIVSVGRGIREKENIAIVEELAQAMGAELAASRPICDAGWLPMERQVGSSGQTVSPKLYLAVGISGAIQHLVGMKGARTIVAINKDPDAPIFEIADYGVAGDLFEVVPALTEEIQKGK